MMEDKVSIVRFALWPKSNSASTDLRLCSKRRIDQSAVFLSSVKSRPSTGAKKSHVAMGTYMKKMINKAFEYQSVVGAIERR